MKHNTTLRANLVEVLADGQFHSGAKLAEQFGLSRTAIANNIAALQELGLDVFSVKGKGYALSKPLALLSEKAIISRLALPVQPQVSLFPVIHSTNTHLKDNIEHMSQGAIVVAEAQTAGRGRRGRQWVSPFGASLYLSMCWRFQGGYQQIGGLSLFVGDCVLKALRSLNVDGLGVKWPNDIYRHGRKLGGILVEVEGQIGSEVTCIIGIGINVDLPDVAHQIDQPFNDLSDLGIDRNHLCAALITNLHQQMPDFETNGLVNIVESWNQYDVFADREVAIISQDTTLRGMNLGINKQGALQLQTATGIRDIHGGEVSLRGA
ncbi:bifunctional biotin--[acetyl-CoA-carboxylase] ligase/biotin operon repressor BirA [Alteromonas sp. ASW11-36]|uniref:Bifunctional ligase/repressor BirA n=1 Tax=Alteromonas arenosi TaxID=3055817 RepID=A0ABT7SZ02_9ALTE|nr:bifunctional biotin--[acetyl-CoA-carboxylase] ligase/biotin operon repressor BirA [Alteromonas sp. ASW11-36]MDM7861417.1 bifunctional biotin--[acetyl-CoA-carboxylase] ligase/biotin operon repressor BirA [Alteromonas sp. ASW11-36]